MKFVTDKEEKEIARKITNVVQDEEQGPEQETEVHRIGRYCEGSQRPLKVKMKS